MHYLMRQTKAELAARIIAVERELVCSEKSNGVLHEQIIRDKIGSIITFTIPSPTATHFASEMKLLRFLPPGGVVAPMSITT